MLGLHKTKKIYFFYTSQLPYLISSFMHKYQRNLPFEYSCNTVHTFSTKIYDIVSISKKSNILIFNYISLIRVNKKKFTLDQATKAQCGSICIALLFL